MFSLEGFSDRKFLLTTGMSIAAIVMGTELNVFNRFFQTTGLTRAQWGACLVIPLGLVAASEAWKWYLRRRAPESQQSLADEPAPTPAPL
jgi:Ca2+-transporting ATPase